MSDPNTIRAMQMAVAHGDLDAAWKSWSEQLPRAPITREVVSATLRLLAAHIAAAPKANRGKVAVDGLTRLRSLLPAAALQSHPLALADVYLAGNLLQDGLELLRTEYHKDPREIELAHRLGLGELARALTAPLQDANLCYIRWRRAIGYLSPAYNDATTWSMFTAGRLDAYRAAFDESQSAEGQHAVHTQIHALLSQHADKAAQAGHAETAQKLGELVLEVEADRSATLFLGRALKCVQLSGDTRPMPFGPLWYEVAGAPEGPRRLLQRIIELTMDVSPESIGGEEDYAGPTAGVQLRQWFSRLRPVRYALNQGQADVAKKALDRLCTEETGCRVNARPQLPVVHGSPKACDPACDRFELCNPGFADASLLESDAHRFAIHTSLALAGFYVRFHPPRLNEAAQEWVRGRMLATVVNDPDGYADRMIAQVMGLLEELWNDPEKAAAMLDHAVASLPHPTLKGRLADRLTDRGIERWNQKAWEQAALDLRAAVRLNRHSLRARTSLCTALQQLGLWHSGEGRKAAAAETARELSEMAAESVKLFPGEASFPERLDWANEHAPFWKKLADQGDDPLAWLS